MSKPVVMRGRIATASGGTAIRISIDKARRIVDLFGSQTQRNAVWRSAAQGMGNFFVRELLPKRIDRRYATTTLGYPLGGSVPFVDTTETMDAVFRRAHAIARMAQGGRGPFAIIRLMAPNKVNQYPNVLAGLKTVAPVEVPQLAQAFSRTVGQVQRTAQRRRIQRGTTAGQLRLSLARPQTASDIAENLTRSNARRSGLQRLANLRQ